MHRVWIHTSTLLLKLYESHDRQLIYGLQWCNQQEVPVVHPEKKPQSLGVPSNPQFITVFDGW